eukprot:TRINITY_DN5737_c1_g1_i1.p1 TRINITY_DN5737_c1_g1~~TRINITY_DN5737_c1_g1_i1.p1  ORF type:complete len:635 (+),score=136.37 TRINITY_DN5737_c1_g1_i1:350-2254(+)
MEQQNTHHDPELGVSHATNLCATPLKKRPVHLSPSAATTPEIARNAVEPSSTVDEPQGSQEGTNVQQYYCKYCDTSWPYTHFRNAQQFGAHCSNCSRKRKVKDPQDLTIRERNKRIRRSRGTQPPQRKMLGPRHLLQRTSPFEGYLEGDEHDVEDEEDDDDEEEDDEDDEEEETTNYELEQQPTKPLLTCLDALRSQVHMFRQGRPVSDQSSITTSEREQYTYHSSSMLADSKQRGVVGGSSGAGTAADRVWALKKAAIRDWTAQRGTNSRTPSLNKPRLTRTSRSVHHHQPSHLPQLHTTHHGKRVSGAPAVMKREDDGREDDATEENEIFEDELDVDSSAESQDTSPKNGHSADSLSADSGPIGDLLVAVEKELAAEKEKRDLADVRAQVHDLKQEISFHWGQGVDDLRERAIDLMKELRVETMSNLESLKLDLSHDFAARQARRKTRLQDVRVQMHAIQRILDSARHDRDSPPELHAFRSNYDSALKQLDDVKAHLSKELSAREQSMQEEFSDARASCSLQLKEVKQRMTEELDGREVRMQKDLDGIKVTMHSMCSRIATDYAPTREPNEHIKEEEEEQQHHLKDCHPQQQHQSTLTPDMPSSPPGTASNLDIPDAKPPPPPHHHHHHGHP